MVGSASRHAPTPAQIARATYSYNWYRAFHQYSDTTQLGSHFWSLASEEQLYLAWPFIVCFLVRRGWLRQFPIAMVVGGVALRMAAWRLFSAERAPWIVYHGGIFPVESARHGCFDRMRRDNARREGIVVCAGVCGGRSRSRAVVNRSHENFGFTCVMPWNYHWVWGYLTIDLIAAALVIACVQSEPITRLLDWRPLARLGQVSYGLYVFHP